MSSFQMTVTEEEAKAVEASRKARAEARRLLSDAELASLRTAGPGPILMAEKNPAMTTDSARIAGSKGAVSASPDYTQADKSLYQQDTDAIDEAAKRHIQAAANWARDRREMSLSGQERNWKPFAREHLAAALELLR
jgi:hypothetical protein